LKVLKEKGKIDKSCGLSFDDPSFFAIEIMESVKQSINPIGICFCIGHKKTAPEMRQFTEKY